MIIVTPKGVYVDYVKGYVQMDDCLPKYSGKYSSEVEILESKYQEAKEAQEAKNAAAEKTEGETAAKTKTEREDGLKMNEESQLQPE